MWAFPAGAVKFVSPISSPHQVGMGIQTRHDTPCRPHRGAQRRGTQQVAIALPDSQDLTGLNDHSTIFHNAEIPQRVTALRSACQGQDLTCIMNNKHI